MFPNPSRHLTNPSGLRQDAHQEGRLLIIAWREDHGPRLRMSIGGELDLLVDDRLDLTVRSFLPDVETLILDLSQVTFMDTAGLDALLQLRHLTASADIDLIAVSAPDQVQRVFHLTKTSPLPSLPRASPTGTSTPA